MMRSLTFANRTIKELSRDPLSYIFCVGFPLVMLVIMTVVNDSIPKEAGMTVFRIDNLAPGIAYFGLTFVMLFTALQVSKDRTTSFLTRLYASPMTALDFVAGYTVPMIFVAVVQQVITFTASLVIAQINGVSMNVLNILLCMLALLPSTLLFVGFGLFFGTLLNDKSAPGICSIIISAAGMLGSIWMDVDSMGGTFKDVCNVLPFYPGVKVARYALSGSGDEILKVLLEIIVYGVVLYILAVIVFRAKMKSDKK